MKLRHRASNGSDLSAPLTGRPPTPARVGRPSSAKALKKKLPPGSPGRKARQLLEEMPGAAEGAMQAMRACWHEGDMHSLEAVMNHLLTKEGGTLGSRVETVPLPETSSPEFLTELVNHQEHKVCMAMWDMLAQYRMIMEMTLKSGASEGEHDQLLFEGYGEFEAVFDDVISYLESCEWAAELLYSKDTELKTKMRMTFRRFEPEGGDALQQEVNRALLQEQERSAKLEHQVNNLSRELYENEIGKDEAQKVKAGMSQEGLGDIEALIQQCTEMDEAFLQREERISEKIIACEMIAHRSNKEVEVSST